MSEELKPCPFCGQQEAFVEQLDSDASVVICQGMVDEHSACLARGPVGVQQSDMEGQPGRDAAIAEWNRRAQPAEAEGAGVVAEAYSHRSRDSMKVTVMNIRQTGRLRDGDKLVRQVDHLAALSAVTAERDRLLSENARLIEDRARFPDRPDDIGHMIGSHIGNLKAGKEQAEKYALKWRDELDSEIRAVDQLRAEVEALREAFGECIQSLHDEMLQSYGGQKPHDMHPATRRNYDRDMAEISEYRAAMAAKEA